MELAAAEGVSPVTVLRAALAALLSRLGAGTDIPLGGRTAAGERIVVPADLSGDPSFTESLHRLHDGAATASRYGGAAFERVVAELAPAARPPYQVELVVEEPVTAASGLAADAAGPHAAEPPRAARRSRRATCPSACGRVSGPTAARPGCAACSPSRPACSTRRRPRRSPGVSCGSSDRPWRVPACR
ncbi:hypothetical protein H4K36_23740 [Streptomyces sp. DHE7-1]|nr:hypothetical protein [Streptomyces sp. DHE7-1]